MDFLLVETGFIALKYAWRGNSSSGSIIPDSCDTEKSSPRLSSPDSRHNTGSSVELRRYNVFVSFLKWMQNIHFRAGRHFDQNSKGDNNVNITIWIDTETQCGSLLHGLHSKIVSVKPKSFYHYFICHFILTCEEELYQRRAVCDQVPVRVLHHDTTVWISLALDSLLCNRPEHLHMTWVP